MPWSKDNLPDSVKDKKWSDFQTAIFIASANALLNDNGNEAEAISMGISQADERKNASQAPRIFYCRHMQPGTCKYENEIVLVDTDALKRMQPSFPGKPVYIHHQKVDYDKIQEQAGGYVTESFYNELDGWAWSKFIAVSDEAHTAIDNGWAVSNAYIPTEWAAKGTKNNVPYGREIKNGEFTHLAIVPNPRYEDAIIMSPDTFKKYQEMKKAELAELRNSNPKGKQMFRMFKTEKKEVTSVDEDTMIDIGNGQEVSVKEMLNAVKAEKTNAKKNDDDQMVEYEGEKIPMKELVSAYKNQKKNEKKNEDEAAAKKEKEEKENADKDAKEKEEKEAAMKKNAEDEAAAKKEKDKEEDDEKKNARFFEELKNANARAESPRTEIIDAPQNLLTRGQKRYGS